MRLRTLQNAAPYSAWQLADKIANLNSDLTINYTQD